MLASKTLLGAITSHGIMTITCLSHTLVTYLRHPWCYISTMSCPRPFLVTAIEFHGIMCVCECTQGRARVLIRLHGIAQGCVSWQASAWACRHTWGRTRGVLVSIRAGTWVLCWSIRMYLPYIVLTLVLPFSTLCHHNFLKTFQYLSFSSRCPHGYKVPAHEALCHSVKVKGLSLGHLI